MPFYPVNETGLPEIDPESGQKSPGRRKFVLLCIGTVFLCLSLTGALSTFISLSLRSCRRQPISPDDFPVDCVKCASINQALSSGLTISARDIEVRLIDGNGMCCLRAGASSDTRNQFMKMVLHSAPGTTPGPAQPPKPPQAQVATTAPPAVAPKPVVNKAIAFMGIDSEIQATMGFHYVIKEWGTKTQANFRRADIGFNSDNGHFQIVKDGIYIVHSHLGLTNRSPASFTQVLYKSNPALVNRGNQHIAGDTEHVTTGDIVASNLFSVLSLQRGDELHINVTNPELIIDDSKFSYFSIHWLSV